jgi:hypothetical protein
LSNLLKTTQKSLPNFSHNFATKTTQTKMPSTQQTAKRIKRGKRQGLLKAYVKKICHF